MSKTANRPPRPASPDLRAIQASRHLRLAAPRHTGHLTPRHTTAYPTLIMIMLCVGVLMFSLSHLATADQASYAVNASVPGPPPSQPATLDSPVDGSQFTSTPINVSGTCPLNTYVGLSRNSFSSGVALCDATGHYQLATDLFPGTNQLVVYDYSFTDAQGPPSNMMTVTYNPPAPPSNPAGGSTTTTSSRLKTTPYNPSSPTVAGLPVPLLLKSNFSFLGYYVGQSAGWKVAIEGGTPPYAVDAEWGDGQQQLYIQQSQGLMNIQHTYANPGGYHGNYVVKISATDVNGNHTFLQLLAIISAKPKTVVAGTGSISGGTGYSWPNVSHMLGLIWSGYGVVLLMLLSFWLGERRELQYVRFHSRRRHA